MQNNNAANAAKKSFRHWDLLCVGVFFIVTTVIFSSFLFTDAMMISSDQLSAVGDREYLKNSLTRHGQTPMWLNARLGGMPSIDAMYGDVFYPVTAAIRPFVPGYRLFGYTMILHVFLAGVFFFFMLRRSFGASRLAAVAGSLFYMLSPQFVSHMSPGHDGKMFVIAWLPFVVWRLRSLLALPTARNAALMALGVGMMVLTPHVQMTYFVLMGVFLYWATDVVKAVVDREGKKRVAGKVVFFWAAVFAGLGMAFVVLYPSYMFVRDAYSVRGVDRGFEFAASWSMNWAEFFSLWVQEFGNSLEYYWGKNYFKLNTEYAGAVPLLLTVLAVASKPKSLWRIFWAAVAALAVLYALGANTPFFTVAYHLVPGVKRFRAPSMIMFWFTFSTALMSYFFIKDLLSRRFEVHGDQRKKWTVGLAAALGGATVIAALFSVNSVAAGFAGPMMGGGDAPRVFQANYAQKFVPNLWLWWLICAVSLGMLIAVVNEKLKPATLVYALILMSTVDMVKVNSQFVKVDSPWKYFYRGDATLNELKTEFAKAPFRVFSLPRTFTTQNQEALYGLEAVGGFHDNELNFYRAFRGEGDANYIGDITEMSGGQLSLSMARIRGSTPFLDLAGVNYILMGSGSGGIGKIENPTSLGRLSYASGFVVLPEDEIISALKSRSYDYRTTVALVEEPELPFAPKKGGGKVEGQVDDDTNKNIERLADGNDSAAVDNQAGQLTDGNDVDRAGNNKVNDNAVKQLKVEWKKYTPNKRAASVTMPDDGFLRLSEAYYPGWVIKIDGAPVKYYRADMAWMAVPLKAGSYEVTMEPKSLYLHTAVPVSIVFTILIAGVLAFGFVRNRSGKKGY